MGPTDGGEDLRRLLRDLEAKGWKPQQLESLKARWEDACHDPMRRGRGGPSLPENAGLSRPAPAGLRESRPARGAGTPEEHKVSWPAKPDLIGFLDRTAPWEP